MPTIPALTTISGEISAAPHNDNYSTIRTYVNDYCAFKDVANTYTALQTYAASLTVSAGGTTLQALTATSATFSSSVAAQTVLDVNTGTALVRIGNTHGSSVSITATWTTDMVLNAGRVRIFNQGSTTEYWQFNAGHLLAGTDNTYDIGASGATRPRAIYVAGAGTFGGGIAVTGNSTIAGTLGSVTTLTCTTVTATNLGGTLSTAAQANVTSVGTLTALTVSGVTILQLGGGGNKIGEATSNGDFWVGPQSAIATTATAGMLILPGCNGAPTGARALGTNGFPAVVDYANSKIYVNFNGTWRSTAALT